MKPDDVTQEAWDEAEKLGEFIHGRHERGWVSWPLCSHDGRPAQELAARAIMSAEQRGAEREREAIITLASEYVWDDHALEQATDIGRAVHHQSVEIVTAIRNRSNAS